MTTALLIIDVQNAILGEHDDPVRLAVKQTSLNDMIGRLQTLQEKARAANVPVVMVQHDGPVGDRLQTGTLGWEIREELAPVAGDIIVHKAACDSFFETDLRERLDELGATRLVVGGCMTQFCVDTTVRRAVSLGYNVTLVSDGHMTADRGGLSFTDIIAHHNTTLDGFDAGECLVSLRDAAEIEF
jgi:nicotinamidase-related amidase